MEPSEVFELYKAGQLISGVMCKHYGTENFHVTIQDGPNAGQSVPHVHLHILPGSHQQIVQAEQHGKARTLEDMRQEALTYRQIIENPSL
jgi:diadenosine tetraphosphate (Ap4A) HIT family hydrolase